MKTATVYDIDFYYRGEFHLKAEYDVNDIVLHRNGSLYRSLVNDNIGHDPALEPRSKRKHPAWELFATRVDPYFPPDRSLLERRE